MPNEQILLCIIAGATIINGLFMVIGIGHIILQLRHIWEAEMLALSILLDDDIDDIDIKVIEKSD